MRKRLPTAILYEVRMDQLEVRGFSKQKAFRIPKSLAAACLDPSRDELNPGSHGTAFGHTGDTAVSRARW